VFTCNGQRIEPMQLRRALQKAMKAAVIGNFTLHDFRHCALTRWHNMKVPPATAMRMAGQSSVQSFKKYINMDAREHAEVFTNCLREHSAPAKNSASA
jgi:integrase